MARLLSAPLAVWLIGEGLLAAAFWVFLGAAITDATDGLAARLLDARTVLGAYLDPLADKTLLTGVYVMLGLEGYLPSWLVILVVFRDVAIVGGVVLSALVLGRLNPRTMMVGKVHTVVQVLLAGVVLAGLGLGLDHRGLADILVIVTAMTAVVSGAAYAVTWCWATAAPGSEAP